MTKDPKPGDCYTRRWYDVERVREQSHVTVRMLGMGVDKPLVGVTLCGTYQDRIMTRIAFDDAFVLCPADTHTHER
jgi:hypothetical protein